MKMMQIRFPEKPRRTRARNAARRCLASFEISALPVNPLKILRTMGIRVTTYSKIANKTNTPFTDLIKSFGSNDGYSFFDAKNQKGVVIYNERINSKGRIRWTLAHELGHFYLGHFTDFPQTKLCREGLTDNQYTLLDNEADEFAGELLGPPIVLNTVNWGTNISALCNCCGISYAAASNRLTYLDSLNSYKKGLYDYEYEIINNFNKFTSQRHCTVCGYHGLVKGYKFCPDCGSELFWKDDECTMRYSSVEVDKAGRAIHCPKCGNEVVDEKDNYCRVCGVYLYNKCTGRPIYDGYDNYCGQEDPCNAPMPGDARYCPYCGAETTFLQNGLLPKWEPQEENQSVTFDADIPF